MFLEKHSRFIRHYQLSFSPRKKRAPTLPLVGETNDYSIMDALESAMKANKALDVKSNADIVELMRIEHHPKRKALVLLFHRASPKAADPMYRKKARQGYTVRTVDRKPDEDQTVSAHLVISTVANSSGNFDAALEEIPGLSMSAVQPVIGRALRDYEYDYTDKKNGDDQTYTTVKTTGIKSESVTDALKTGEFRYITLVRPAKARFIDSEEDFAPVDERMKIRVTGDVTSKNWRDKIGGLARRARAAGWTSRWGIGWRDRQFQA